MKIYNKKGFILGIYYLLMAGLSIFLFSLGVLEIKLLVLVFILFIISFTCACNCIARSLSEKTSKDDITAARTQKKASKELEKANGAIKFLNSVEKVTVIAGIFCSAVSGLLLILVLIVSKIN